MFFEIFVITLILADATDVCSLQLTDFTTTLIEILRQFSLVESFSFGGSNVGTRSAPRQSII
jgi:hypothetical protein